MKIMILAALAAFGFAEGAFAQNVNREFIATGPKVVTPTSWSPYQIVTFALKNRWRPGPYETSELREDLSSRIVCGDPTLGNVLFDGITLQYFEFADHESCLNVISDFENYKGEIYQVITRDAFNPYPAKVFRIQRTFATTIQTIEKKDSVLIDRTKKY